MKKVCKNCKKEKQSKDFYGVQGECKTCTKIRVSANYYKNREYYREYEIKRQKDPNRRKMKLDYQRTLRLKNPGKYKARTKVSNSLRSGLIIRKPCEQCGNEKSQAHHDDYRKPLCIKWLCRKHHMEIENKIPF